MLKVYSTRAINQASVIIEKYVLLPLEIFTTLYRKFSLNLQFARKKKKKRRYKYIVEMKNDFLNEKR